MTFPGRSIDDLPLAAYSTGVEPDAIVRSEPPAGTASRAANEDVAAETPAPSFAPAAFGADDLDAELEPDRAAPRSRPTLPAWLANPRAHARDPRLLMSGLIGIGAVLLVASFLFGGGSPAGAVGPSESESARPVAVTPAPPSGDATVDMSGKLTGSSVLAGATGTGPATGGRMDVTWADAAGAVLSLAGPASAGTRTTDATFVLAWTVVVDGAAVTFTSADGECTVGMAVQPRTVTGSFVCKKLKSPDGKLTIDLRGTYRT